MNLKALFLPVLVAASLLTGCNGASQSNQSESGAAKVAPTPAPAETRYMCPMGCEGSESSKPGRCPVCDMDLEKKS